VTPLDPLALAGIVAHALDELGIPYVIGGSVASSLYGEPRSSLDLDLMIDATPEQAEALAAKLSSDFYVPIEDVPDAARSRRSFNAIHLSTAMKVDFFFVEDEPFAKRQMDRRRKVFFENLGIELFFYAPEDVLIRKLLWFRAGDGVSERQWRDVVGLLKSRADLDFGYLRDVAAELGLGDLLSKALAAAGR
jgi:Nucleotidyl transferase AbiEii toxin, Type IV TA system